MSNKFWREARDISRLFCLEYEADLSIAKSNLQERLKGKRKRIYDWTYDMIRERIPGIDLNG